MGCDISYKGCIPDELTQEKLINFLLTKMAPEKVILPRPEILVNRINEYYDIQRVMKNIGWEYDEEIIDHEPVVPNHPFNFYGVAFTWDWEEMRDRFQFVFDRTDRGRLVSIIDVPSDDLSTDIQNQTTDVRVVHCGGFVRTTGVSILPELLAILKVRYFEQLEVNDDYESYDATIRLIDSLGFAQELKDEKLTLDDCISLLYSQSSKYHKEDRIKQRRSILRLLENLSFSDDEMTVWKALLAVRYDYINYDFGRHHDNSLIKLFNTLQTSEISDNKFRKERLILNTMELIAKNHNQHFLCEKVEASLVEIAKRAVKQGGIASSESKLDKQLALLAEKLKDVASDIEVSKKAKENS